MTRTVAVLRPEPGNAATSARIEALGLFALRMPLFAVVPAAWDAPDPARFDGLLVTSANALRHAGPALARYRHLPVHAVGGASARAARAAGFIVATEGQIGVAELLPQVQGQALLHLAGREHRPAGPPVRATAIVYASEPVPPPPGGIDLLDGGVALLHSPRAAARLAELVDAAGVPRARIDVAAISAAAAAAAGSGWHRVAVAPRPDDATLIATARLLAD